MDWTVHADDAIVVVNKPAGLLSVPGRGADKADCAAARVRAQWPDALVVHRLDMATSGLLAFARGPAAQRTLGIAFIGRQVEKHYVALVQGRPGADEGRIDLPLAADWPNRPRQRVDAEAGKPSTTLWRVLADEGRGITRLELRPVTGRSHQLRVHLAAQGWPILGDPLYGHVASAPRLMLHASRLAFAHPADRTARTFTSAPPF